MKVTPRMTVNVVLSALTIFCFFGFVAAGEPGVGPYWKPGFALGATVLIFILLQVNRRRKPRR